MNNITKSILSFYKINAYDDNKKLKTFIKKSKKFTSMLNEDIYNDDECWHSAAISEFYNRANVTNDNWLTHIRLFMYIFNEHNYEFENYEIGITDDIIIKIIKQIYIIYIINNAYDELKSDDKINFTKLSNLINDDEITKIITQINERNNDNSDNQHFSIDDNIQHFPIYDDNQHFPIDDDNQQLPIYDNQIKL